MNFSRQMLPLVAALLCVPVLLVVPAMASPNGLTPVNQQRRREMRTAVSEHRASQWEEVRREEAAAGRHLTAAELAQLREQVRQQWATRTEAIRFAESQPVERMVQVPESGAAQAPAKRLQRP